MIAFYYNGNNQDHLDAERECKWDWIAPFSQRIKWCLFYSYCFTGSSSSICGASVVPKLPSITKSRISDPFLRKLYDCIENNIQNPQLSVETLAEKMNMSRRTLHRKLEMIAGASTGKMIKQCRLHKAAKLLENGNNISETAFMVGFESASYFSTAFKNFFGVTPLEYEKDKKPISR